MNASVFVAALVMLGSVVACGGSTPAAETPLAPPAEAAPVETAPATEKPAAATTPAAEADKEPRHLEVKIEAKSNSKLTGKATLVETGAGAVRVSLTVEGVEPGDHGAHIHEKGDCSAPDATSAGGHFNPEGHDHALPAVEKRHLGDLGNLAVGKDGKGSLEIVIPGANLTPGDPHSFAGRAIIVHAKKDDGGQPVGNAGGRIGCGVIGS